jgi:PAS domain S-box-containing protein
MKKNFNKKKTKPQAFITELSQINQKREKELQEIDRIAKMLVRRDFELSQMREKREEELYELKKTKEALMNILEDVEEARSREEDEKNKTLAIINNFTDGLLFFDKRNKLLLINPKAESLFKIKKEILIGQPVSVLAKVDSLCSLIKILEKEIKKDSQKIFKKELKIGKNLILETSIVPIIKNRERMGILVILHDISREKLVEKIKTEFVSLAAHQLRTPLSAIKWIIKMFLDGDLGRISKEQKEFLEDAYKSNERMIELVNNLLDVSRIEEGRYIFKPSLSSLEEIIQERVAYYQPEAQKKGLKLEFKKPKKAVPKIMLDREKIMVAIDNLIRNGLKYTLRKGRVTISLKGGPEEAEVSVQDTGVGIPQDQQKRIFTKFFRASNVVRMDTTGSGLGLYIVKNIIEAHGGRIWFQSEEGKGTTFYFTLPINQKSGGAAGKRR